MKRSSKTKQFFDTVGNELVQSLTTGSKLNRAEAGMGDASLALAIVGIASLWIPGVGVSLLAASAAIGATSSGIQFGQGAYEYNHGQKALGSSNMEWGSAGLALSIIDLGAAGAAAKGMENTAKALGAAAMAGGFTMTGVGLAESIRSGNDLGIVQAGLGLGLGVVGAGISARSYKTTEPSTTTRVSEEDHSYEEFLDMTNYLLDLLTDAYSEGYTRSGRSGPALWSYTRDGVMVDDVEEAFCEMLTDENVLASVDVVDIYTRLGEWRDENPDDWAANAAARHVQRILEKTDAMNSYSNKIIRSALFEGISYDIRENGLMHLMEVGIFAYSIYRAYETHSAANQGLPRSDGTPFRLYGIDIYSEG